MRVANAGDRAWRMTARDRQQKRARERDRPFAYEEQKHESSYKDRRREQGFVFRVALALMRAFSGVSFWGLRLVLAGGGGLRLRHLQQLLARAREGGRAHPDGTRAGEQFQVFPPKYMPF